MTYKELVDQVRHAALGLREYGVQPGQNLAIMSPSMPRWFAADLAALIGSAVSVPIYHNVAEDNFLFEMKEADIKAIFAASKEAWELIRKHRDLFNVIIALDTPPDDIDAIKWEALIAQGQEAEEKNPQKFDNILYSLTPDTIATIMYTSGTTGEPKGVVHAQKSLVRTVTYEEPGWNHSTSFLNILPAAHIMGRMFIYSMLYSGATVYFLTDVLQFRNVCQEVKPTDIAVVPRLLEKVYNTLAAKVQHANPFRRALAEAALAVARKKKDNLFTKLLYPIFDKLVYSKIRDIFGGRVACFFCGGANLDPDLEYFFDRVGLPISIGWGMTEVSVSAGTCFSKKKLGTVGPRIAQDVELAISNEGEVLVRGSTLMKEYYKDSDTMSRQFDDEGWFHTGDRGSLDEDGYLTIERRIKELYKTSRGEYISPIGIETELQKHPLIEIAILIGDGRKYATVLLFPDFEVVAEWKKRRRKENLSDEEFLNSKQIQTNISRFIRKMNHGLNTWEKVHTFKFIMRKASIQGGELTPTMKLRRYHIVRKYSYDINEMYQKPSNVLKTRIR